MQLEFVNIRDLRIWTTGLIQTHFNYGNCKLTTEEAGTLVTDPLLDDIVIAMIKAQEAKIKKIYTTI